MRTILVRPAGGSWSEHSSQHINPLVRASKRSKQGHRSEPPTTQVNARVKKGTIGNRFDRSSTLLLRGGSHGKVRFRKKRGPAKIPGNITKERRKVRVEYNDEVPTKKNSLTSYLNITYVHFSETRLERQVEMFQCRQALSVSN